MTTRKEIEMHVVATNKYLGIPYRDEDRTTTIHPPKVQQMNIIELLRNLHPLMREPYARQLYQEKVINEKQLFEFIDRR